MLAHRSIQSSLTLKDKIFSLDYILILSVLILGIISMFAMYSTDGGEFNYHTKSHILRFSVFFLMFLVLSLFQIRVWHQSAFLIYIVFFIAFGCQIFWVNIIRFTKMVKSLFYESTTIRTYENRLDFILSQILS